MTAASDPSGLPRDPTEQKTCYSSKKKLYMLQNLWLINTALRILFLNETHSGSVHDECMADTTSYPLSAESQLLQDLAFQAFTLEGVNIIQPTRKPRRREVTPEQKEDNRDVARRRLGTEHVNSSVTCCRMLKEIIRTWKDRMRDMVMEIGCALHNFSRPRHFIMGRGGLKGAKIVGAREPSSASYLLRPASPPLMAR
jgi:hypothetical protein